MRASHGRYLSGLGGESVTGQVGYDPAYQGQETDELELQDDTFGSGIFDAGGRSGTANANMGVFASHYALPGYVARSVPFTVSRDVTDITDDAEVVIVPGGGLSYVESRGKLTRPAILGPTWVPPRIQPSGVTSRNQVYAFLTRPGQTPPPPLNASAPVRPPPTYRPPRQTKFWLDEVRATPAQNLVPSYPRQSRLPSQSNIDPYGPGIAVRGPQCGFSGDESEKSPATTAQLAAAGMVAGAAVALFALVAGSRK